MDSSGRVIGKVLGIEPAGPNSEFVVVEDRSSAQYPVMVACECYGKTREQLRDIKPGQWVRVIGQLRSNRSQKNGKLYTSFSAYQVWSLDHQSTEVPPWAQTQPWPPRKHTELSSAPQPPDPRIPDDEIPEGESPF